MCPICLCGKKSTKNYVANKMKILLIDTFSPHLLDALIALKQEVNYRPDIQREEVLSVIQDYEILILNSKVNIDKELIDKAQRLKLAIRAGVGMDHFDLEYLAEKGIIATNTAGANADAVGEQAVGMLLALRHKIAVANAQVKDFQWIREANRGVEIKGKTVGIIGFGNTGSTFARKLQGFDCELIAYDKYKTNFGNNYVKEVSLGAIFQQSDILSLHIPLTKETRNWVNTEFFHSFTKAITFLNLSRGEIVVLPDLIQALHDKKVLFAGIDVLENEKLATLSPTQKEHYTQLFSLDNVIITPHIGGWSVESKDRIEAEIVKIVAE
jgi:D-3-phosphoglycerate dehydrogenase / 2-oxoglutarate reductase